MMRVVVAGPGEHDATVSALARALRDGGHEVVRTGPDPTPEQVVATVLQEDADLVGLVAPPAADVTAWLRVRELLVAHDAADVVVFGCGVVPDDDRAALARAGVRDVLAPGTRPGEVGSWAAAQEQALGG